MIAHHVTCLPFYNILGEELIINTEESYKYEKIWKNIGDRTFYSFRVTACRDVHVLLTAQAGEVTDNQVYEMVIGGWQGNMSVIRYSVLGGYGSIKASHNKTGMLDCDNAKDFWISWRKGIIEVELNTI